MKVKKRKKRIEPKKVRKTNRKETEEIKKTIDEKVDKVVKKNKVYKVPEFNAYILWKTLPASLRGLSDDDLELMGLKDKMAKDLLKIFNQEEFAKKYKVRTGTLSDWNKKIYEENLIFDSMGIWAKAMTPNIIMSLGKTALKKGEANEINGSGISPRCSNRNTRVNRWFCYS